MNVFLEPIGLHSRSMLRTARALKRYAPSGVRIVDCQEDADLIVLHVIGADAISRANAILARGRRYAAIQYCLLSAGLSSVQNWIPFWKMAEVVMSYYDLSPLIGQFKFHLAPLGIDDAFREEFPSAAREKLVITSGFVTGPSAEAIEEVWIAAERAGVKAIHVGPAQVEGMAAYPQSWNAVCDLSDDELASLYRRATWVSALRQVEGFELPGIEGFACGARPLVFNQPSMDRWYRDFGIFIEPCFGDELVNRLVPIFSTSPEPIDYYGWASAVYSVFDWERICREFWKRVEYEMERAA